LSGEVKRISSLLAEVVGPEDVAVDGLERYGFGALMRYRAFKRPSIAKNIVAVFPESTEEVAEVIKLANKEKIAVIPYGGGTGLMGGATPINEPTIMIDLRRMRRIEEISPEDMTATAEAGITIEELDMELRKRGVMLGHDPWSSPRATLGGAIATNGMGYYVASYGSIREQTLGLEVVLPNGDVIRTRAASFSSTGPQLKHLFIGAEGIFGVITKATVRIFPLPEREEKLGYVFDNFEDGFNAVMEMRMRKITPSVLDMGEEAYGFSDPTQEYQTELFILVEGFKEEVEAKKRRIEEICEKHGGRKLGGRWAENFWEHRHDLIYLYDEYLQQGKEIEWFGENILDYIHIYLPASKVLEYKRRTAEIMKRHGILLYERGLWGHPELFSIVFLREAKPNREKALEETEKAIDKMISLCHDMGGSMEHCHGVGIRLKKYMQQEHGQTGINLLKKLKQTIDPNNIMNPGKLIY